MGASRGRRTGLILIILILLILIAGGAAIYLLQNGLLGETSEVPEEVEVVPTATPPPAIRVIVAARDIPRGARLGIQDVTTIPWPDLAEAPPPIDALIVTEGEGFGLEQVEDRIVRVDILKGQPILNFMITPGEEPIGLADRGSDAALLIPSGSVMMTIPISRLSAAGYALREGDHVDVFASVQFVNIDEDFQTLLPNRLQLLTDDEELIAAGLQSYQYVEGREEDGPFGTTLLVMPGDGDVSQRSRQATQLLIDNAIVVRMGEWPINDLHEPIVITPAPPPTAVPQDQTNAEPAAEEAPPTPTPVPPAPDIISLAMSRQDALVLKYTLEQGANIDLVLRSALDDDVNNVTTDTVTLEYIIQFYDVEIPNSLPQALEPTTAQDLLDALASEAVEEPAQ
jgi:Flp pilus assembly protein CpaB